MRITEVKNEIEKLNKRLDELNKEYEEIHDYIILEEAKVIEGGTYYNVYIDSAGAKVLSNLQNKSFACNCNYDIGNYFQIEKEANKFAKELNVNFLIHKYHDIIYPDFQVPKYDELYYVIQYDYVEQKYQTYSYNFNGKLFGIPFRTVDIAKKVCKLVNFEYNKDEHNYGNNN